MEDDLNILETKTTSIFLKIEDDLNIFLMEDNLNIFENGRRPQYFSQPYWMKYGRLPNLFENGRRPNIFENGRDFSTIRPISRAQKICLLR
jgi:hypothetical protein